MTLGRWTALVLATLPISGCERSSPQKPIKSTAPNVTLNSSGYNYLPGGYDYLKGYQESCQKLEELVSQICHFAPIAATDPSKSEQFSKTLLELNYADKWHSESYAFLLKSGKSADYTQLRYKVYQRLLATCNNLPEAQDANKTTNNIKAELNTATKNFNSRTLALGR